MTNESSPELQPRPRGLRIVQTMDDVLPVETDDQLEHLKTKSKPIGSFGNAELVLEREVDRISSVDGPALAVRGNELLPMLRSEGESTGLASFYIHFITNDSLPPGRTGKITLYIDGMDNPLTSTSIKEDVGKFAGEDLDLAFSEWKVEGNEEEKYLLAPFTPEFLSHTEIQFETIDDSRGGDN